MSDSVYLVELDYRYDGNETVGIFGERDEALRFAKDHCEGEATLVYQYPIGWNNYDEAFDGHPKLIACWTERGRNKYVRTT